MAKIYLIVNVITKLIEDIETILVRIPSIEKILKFELELLLREFINEENEIVFLKILLPNSQIKFETSYENDTIPEQIDKEKFMNIHMKIARITNLYGDSTS